MYRYTPATPPNKTYAAIILSIKSAVVGTAMYALSTRVPFGWTPEPSYCTQTLIWCVHDHVIVLHRLIIWLPLQYIVHNKVSIKRLLLAFNHGECREDTHTYRTVQVRQRW